MDGQWTKLHHWRWGRRSSFSCWRIFSGIFGGLSSRTTTGAKVAFKTQIKIQLPKKITNRDWTMKDLYYIRNDGDLFIPRSQNNHHKSNFPHYDTTLYNSIDKRDAQLTIQMSEFLNHNLFKFIINHSLNPSSSLCI